MTFDFKHAAPGALKNEYDRIAKEIGDDRFFTRKELKHLPSILSDGEQVLAFTSGLMDGHTWLISLTDRRIIFLNKGLIYGLQQVAIDLDKVNSVSGVTRLLFGTILIEDSARNREITDVAKRSVIPFTNKTRDAIEARKHPASSAQAPAVAPESGNDMISKLERLGELKAKGILTEAEFAQQKERILAA